MINTQSSSTAARRTPGQRERLGKFITNPYPAARPAAKASVQIREELPIRPRWAGWR